jgi:hypothetical protein
LRSDLPTVLGDRRRLLSSPKSTDPDDQEEDRSHGHDDLFGFQTIKSGEAFVKSMQKDHSTEEKSA